MSYDILGLRFQLGLQTLEERCHLLFLKVCICLLLLLFYIYIFTIQPLFISQSLDIERASSFIKYTTINKGFILLHRYFIFNMCLQFIFSYPYVNNALTTHNQCGFYGLRQVLHFTPLQQCALTYHYVGIATWVFAKYHLDFQGYSLLFNV